LGRHTFIAIKVPSHIQTILSNWAAHFQEQIPLKSWTDQEDYHITLSFLGETADSQIEQLSQELNEAVQHHTPFQLFLDGIGTFGRETTPRVLWAGVDRENRLVQLQKGVYQACKHSGFQWDNRPYRPHITLGKKWAGTEPVSSDFLNFELEDNRTNWLVEEIALYEIRPNQLPRYHPMHVFKL
jgi:2'-5' RNA ligase